MANYADLDGLRDAWVQYLHDAGMCEASRHTHIWTVDFFLTWLHGHKKDELSPTLVERWKGEMISSGLRPTTVNTVLSAMRKFSKWALLHRHLSDNPLDGVQNVRRDGANKAHLRDRLEDDEILRTLAVPDRSTDTGRRDYAILCVKAYTGMRDIELYRASFDDLSLAGGMPVLRIQGKGRADTNRVAVIHNPQAQEALAEWLAVRGSQAGALFLSYSDRSPGERLSLRAIHWIIKRALVAAGINDRRKTSHSIRHSAITKTALHNILKAQEMAGHADTQTTLIYVHEAERITNPGERFIDYGEPE